MIQKAKIIATKAHLRQCRRDGSPYISHPIRVAELVERAGGDETQIALAYCHDCVEDTEMTVHDFQTMGFSPRFVRALEAISRKKHESRTHYIFRVLCCPDARMVKKWDIVANLDPLCRHSKERAFEFLVFSLF